SNVSLPLDSLFKQILIDYDDHNVLVRILKRHFSGTPKSPVASLAAPNPHWNLRRPLSPAQTGGRRCGKQRRLVIDLPRAGFFAGMVVNNVDRERPWSRSHGRWSPALQGFGFHDLMLSPRRRRNAVDEALSNGREVPLRGIRTFIDKHGDRTYVVQSVCLGG